MKQIASITRVHDRVKEEQTSYHEQKYKRDNEFFDCLSKSNQKRKARTVKECEKELQDLWRKLTCGNEKLKLKVHPAVYVKMANQIEFSEQIKQELHNCFASDSVLFSTISLALTRLGEVLIEVEEDGTIECFV